MDVIGGCPACGRSARVNQYGDITCRCEIPGSVISFLLFSVVVVFTLVAAAGCVEREAQPEPIYISCTAQIHRVELKWAKAVKECRSRLTVCEMIADEECAK
jgi:hypothetical protein